MGIRWVTPHEEKASSQSTVRENRAPATSASERADTTSEASEVIARALPFNLEMQGGFAAPPPKVLLQRTPKQSPPQVLLPITSKQPPPAPPAKDWLGPIKDESVQPEPKRAKHMITNPWTGMDEDQSTKVLVPVEEIPAEDQTATLDTRAAKAQAWVDERRRAKRAERYTQSSSSDIYVKTEEYREQFAQETTTKPPWMTKEETAEESPAKSARLDEPACEFKELCEFQELMAALLVNVRTRIHFATSDDIPAEKIEKIYEDVGLQTKEANKIAAAVQTIAASLLKPNASEDDAKFNASYNTNYKLECIRMMEELSDAVDARITEFSLKPLEVGHPCFVPEAVVDSDQEDARTFCLDVVGDPSLLWTPRSEEPEELSRDYTTHQWRRGRTRNKVRTPRTEKRSAPPATNLGSPARS